MLIKIYTFIIIDKNFKGSYISNRNKMWTSQTMRGGNANNPKKVRNKMQSRKSGV